MLTTRKDQQPLQLLCLGAHSDDIEIGCGGTLSSLTRQHPDCTITWVVLSGEGVREEEARQGAQAFCGTNAAIEVHRFRDGYFPYDGARIKDFFETLKRRTAPDLIFTHMLDDRHQDHRLVAELTWNTFRNHTILEYEIAKYDADLKAPSIYVPLARSEAEQKAQMLLNTFQSQRSREWFTVEAFLALMRLRGMECNAADGYAEGFHCRKLILGPMAKLSLQLRTGESK